jgi:hypothetical protein
MKTLLPAVLVVCVYALPSHATITTIDYVTEFNSPVQVITDDQPFGLISGDPGSGVTFINPNFFHWTNELENSALGGGTGGSVTVDLNQTADRFGLFAGANSSGTSLFNLEFFFGAASVGTGNFVLPSGQPSTPIAAAFSSDVPFDSVVLTAPSNGFMRINEDSIRFQPVPEPSSLALAALGLLGMSYRRRKQA